MPSFQKLNFLLAKVQTDQDSAIGGLTVASDFVTVDDNFEITHKTNFSEQSLAQGFFGNPQQVKGTQECDVKVTMPIIPTATTTPPNVHDFLLSSGMVCDDDTTPIYTYTPTSDIVGLGTAMELWAYTGDKSSGNALLTKSFGTMFDLKITGKLGEAAKCEFTGKGIPVASPSAVTYPTDSFAAIAQSGAVPSVIKATSMTVGGITSKILEFEATLGGEVVLKKNPANDSGNGQAVITSRKSQVKAKIYQEGLSSGNPYQTMQGQAIGDFSMQWGTGATNANVRVYSDSCEIIDVKQGEDNGLNIFDITCALKNNDWQLDINK
jgi:hypothetical protein